MSSPLIQSFKTSHQGIISTIDQILPFVRAYNQARPHLRTLNELLLNHFSCQDARMFDKLNNYYRGNREAEKMLEFLSDDLKSIKVKYLVFFDKHSGELGSAKSPNFAVDVQEFFGDVIDRVKVEEEYLLPLIDRLPVNT